MANSPADRRPARRFDSPEQEAYLALWRTYDRLRAVEDELFARWDLSAQQYNALRLLRAAHPEPIATFALAAKLVSRAPDATRLIDKLVARGLVTRSRSDADRRAVLINITPAGVAVLDEIAGPLADCHRRQLGHMPRPDLAALTALLREARRPHEPDGSTWT
jgi:DNA-binding MarR family transcriptional regulator